MLSNPAFFTFFLSRKIALSFGPFFRFLLIREIIFIILVFRSVILIKKSFETRNLFVNEVLGRQELWVYRWQLIHVILVLVLQELLENTDVVNLVRKGIHDDPHQRHDY